MKTSFFIAALLFLAVPVLSQDPTVQIKLNDEERFRFDSIQLIFVNPSHHVMIGDSVGMNDAANAVTEENTFLGFKAGSVNQGGWNTFLGTRAGERHTTGNDNVYLGGWAGRYDSTGFYNTYVGANSGWLNKTGDRNTFLGRNSGLNSDSSSSCTFIGYNAGYYHSGGLNNVFIGRNTGAYSGRYSSVNNNTYLGSYAGHNNIYGEGNVFVGYRAGMNDTLSNRLYIANIDTVQPLIYGEFDNAIVRLNANRLEISNPAGNTIIGDSAGACTLGPRNTFIGERSGYRNTDGHDNVFVGDSAGYENLTGIYNVFMGNWAGWKNTSGQSNVFLGTGTGMLNTEGSYNVFIGHVAGNSNTTGVKNTFLGYFAGSYNTTGYRNTFVGLSAGGYNTTGSCNTAIGRNAGFYNETGDSCVYIGNKAGFNELGSNKLYISNSDTVHPLIYGEFDNKLLRVHGTLDIKGVYHFPIADGSNGQVLKTDGAGSLGWSSDVGATNINGLSDGKTSGPSVFLGSGAGMMDNGSNYNVGVGYTALLLNASGMYNTAIGAQSLYDNSVGDFNTATGYQALNNNTTAGYNTANGAHALHRNSTGWYNNAIGYASLYSNINGYYNTANGYNALYHNTASCNTAVGYQSLYMNSTGQYNTAVGNSALVNTTTGNYNTALGNAALTGNKGGHGNVAIGYRADYQNENGSDNTIIGYEAGKGTPIHSKSGNVFLGYQAGYYEVGSDRLYIANSDTTDPLIYGEFDNELLRVNGTLDIKGLYQFPITDGANGQVLKTDGSGNLGWADAGGDFSNGGEAGGADRTLGNTDNYSLGFLTNNTQRVKINNDGGIRLDGNLGIFTDPDAPGINKSLRIYAGEGYSNPYIYVSGYNSAALQLESRRSEGTSGQLWSIVSGSGSNTDLDKFIISNPTDGVCMAIRSGGNIGIGTSAPDYKLHIQSTAASHLQLKNTGDNETRIHLDANRNNSDNQIGIVEGRWNGTTVSQMIFFSGDDAVNKDEGYISFFTRSASLTEKMRISPEGNVGVMVTDPSSKVDIYSPNGYDQLRLRSSFTPSGSSDASGDIGDVAWDDGYIYIKTSNGWKRTSLETF